MKKVCDLEIVSREFDDTRDKLSKFHSVLTEGFLNLLDEIEKRLVESAVSVDDEGRISTHPDD